MPQSLEFRKFEARIKQLRRHLLPKAFSLTGDYSPRQLDMAMAYRLLCHAEIENHIENSSKKVVLSKTLEGKSGISNFTCLTLLAYHRIGWEGLQVGAEDTIPVAKIDSPNSFKLPLGKILDEAISEYVGRIINSNHGVRTENLHRLLKPIGIDFDNVDETWLATIDEFGKARGHTAHKSAVGVTRPIDPKDELDRVELILIGLRNLDTSLKQLIKSKR